MPYSVRRVLQVIPVLIGVAVITFLLMHMVPGDPARVILGPGARDEAIAALHRRWGLDQTFAQQFWLFVQRTGRGDLGESLYFGQPVGSLIWHRIGATLWLLVYSMVLTVLISFPLAIWSASRRGTSVDTGVRIVPLVGLGMPTFWLGIILLQVFAIRLPIFPVGGYGEGFLGHLHSMFLPSLTVAFAISPLVIRALRASMIEEMDSEHVMSARAKGLSERRVVWRHGFRVALIPVVAILGLNVAFLVGGAVTVESVFAVPGLGELLFRGIQKRDFAIVQGVTLTVTIMVVFVSLATDLIYARLDPRVRLS